MDILMVKNATGFLVPLNDDDADQLRRIKAGYVVECKIIQKRNPEFHRKFFALLQTGFDAWTESRPYHLEYNGVPVKPEMERFRQDVTILAGFYRATYTLKGEVRLEAESISFASMDQERFERLYSAVIDVLLERILSAQGFTAESLREHVERVLSFDR